MNAETGTIQAHLLNTPSKENLCGSKSMQFGSFQGDDDSIATVRKFSRSSTQVNLLNTATIKQKNI